MSDWVRCNACCSKPGNGKRFCLTNCGHIFCEDCLKESPDKCRMCRNPCKSILLTSRMKPEVEEYFTDLTTLIDKQHKKLLQVYEFQKCHWKKITSCHEKQEVSLELMKKKLPRLLEIEREVVILREENSHLRRLLADGHHGKAGSNKLPSPGTSLRRAGHGTTPSPTRYSNSPYSRSTTSTAQIDSGIHQHWQTQVPRTPAGPSRLTVRTPPSNGMIGTPRRTPSPHQRPGSAGNTPGLLLRTGNTPGPQEAITPSIFRASGTPGHFSPMNMGSPMPLSRASTPGSVWSLSQPRMLTNPHTPTSGRSYLAFPSPGLQLSQSQSNETASHSSQLDPAKRQIQLRYQPSTTLIRKPSFVTTPGNSRR